MAAFVSKYLSVAILAIPLLAGANPCDPAIPLNSCTTPNCTFRYTDTPTETVNLLQLPVVINAVDSCLPELQAQRIPINSVVDLTQIPTPQRPVVSNTVLLSAIPTFQVSSIGPVNIPTANVSFTYTRWIATSSPDCNLPGGMQINGSNVVGQGQTFTTYTSPAPVPPLSCAAVSISSTCSGGFINQTQLRLGTFNVAPGNYPTCDNGCTGPDGRVFSHGQSGIYYTTATAPDCNDPTVIRTRTCSNGTLSNPSGVVGSCVNTPACSWTVDQPLGFWWDELGGAANLGPYFNNPGICTGGIQAAPLVMYNCSAPPTFTGDTIVRSVGATCPNELPPVVRSAFASAYRCICSSATVNGACGSAESTPSVTAPVANLCNFGNPTAVLDGGANWLWSCNGVNGGSNANCSTSKAPTLRYYCGSSGGGAPEPSCTNRPDICLADDAQVALIDGSACGVLGQTSTYSRLCDDCGVAGIGGGLVTCTCAP